MYWREIQYNYQIVGNFGEVFKICTNVSPFRDLAYSVKITKLKTCQYRNASMALRIQIAKFKIRQYLYTESQFAKFNARQTFPLYSMVKFGAPAFDGLAHVHAIASCFLSPPIAWA